MAARIRAPVLWVWMIFENGKGEFLSFRFHVDDLAADHSLGAGASGDDVDDPPQDLGWNIPIRLGVGKENEGFGQKAVASQDGDGLTEDFVVGRSAPAKIIIVHGRQVVMDQGIGMNHFHGAGRGNYPFHLPADGFAGRDHEHRADALPSGENRIAHRFMQACRQDVFRGKVLVEGDLKAGLPDA